MKVERNVFRSLQRLFIISFFVLSTFGVLLSVHAQTAPGEQTYTGPYGIDVSSSDRSSPDKKLSQLYTRYARDAFQRDELELADEYAESALLFTSNQPDALYIRGVSASSQKQFEKAEDFFSRALISTEWNYFDPSDARRRLVEILYRKRRHREAYHVFAGYFGGESGANPSQPVDSSLYIRLLVQLDSEERAATAARRAQKAFPENGELQALRVELDPGFRRNVEEKILAGDSQKKYTRRTYQSLVSVLVDSAPTAEAPARMQRLLDAYEKR